MKEEKDMTPILLKDLGISSPIGSKYRYHYGLFKCQYCGKEFKTRLDGVKNKTTIGCGCRIGGKKHGLRHHKFYKTWTGMMDRCYNEKSHAYPRYGGRGITVCDEWKNITNFISWVEKTYIEGCTLDRIDNDKGYSHENCRWADATIQNINQRIKKSNTSGFVGVSWVKKYNKWVSRISFKGIRTILGYYENIEDAVKARDNYIIENNLPHKLSTEYKKEEK